PWGGTGARPGGSPMEGSLSAAASPARSASSEAEGIGPDPDIDIDLDIAIPLGPEAAFPAGGPGAAAPAVSMASGASACPRRLTGDSDAEDSPATGTRTGAAS